MIDCVTPRMAVDNAVYPIDTSSLAANIACVIYNFQVSLGSIEYNDRPPVGAAFTDPSPYLSFLNAWMVASAADSPPLQLAQAIAVKQALTAGIYNGKKATLQAAAPVATWQLPVAQGPNPTNTSPPINGFWQNAGFNEYGTPGYGTVTNVGVNSNSLYVSTDYPCLNGGKYYWEFINSGTNSSAQADIGIVAPSVSFPYGSGNKIGQYSLGWSYSTSGNQGQKCHNNVFTNYDTSGGFANTDVIGVALDLVNEAIWFSRNGVWKGGASLAEIAAGTTTHAAYTGLTGASYYPAAYDSGPGDILTGAFGPPYRYTPPTGFTGVNPLLFDASDAGLANINAGVYTPIGGSPLTLQQIEIDSITNAIVSKRSALTNYQNTTNANLAACASIAQVIAFDPTTGWPS